MIEVRAQSGDPFPRPVGVFGGDEIQFKFSVPTELSLRLYANFDRIRAVYVARKGQPNMKYT